MTAPRPKNRLAEEKSPYLLQHAGNPVDWYPYGDEAFRKAREEDRPIFLSIGYSTCHWCHVMERESFEDPETARVMNEHYVNIKVDREERPDVDQIYMQAVMALTGRGGWPLNVWLTPDLRPFYGGTYFPPTPRFGMPPFRQVLLTMAQFHRDHPERVAQQAAEFMKVLEEEVPPAEGALPADLWGRAEDDLRRHFDVTWGGFGGAPKFPQPARLSALVHRAVRHPVEREREMLETTLEMMWRGGIYDHVGGGFARYSVDDRWLVPHFEKMLYDNAQLVDVYLDGHLRTGREDFARIARDVLDFVTREMTHPEGGFYSAQDADSEGEEGRFYVFTPEDVDAALGEDAPEARRLFGVTPGGNFEGRSILWWPRGVEETAGDLGLDVDALLARYEDFRRRLYAWREARVRPGLDDKVLTSWNGLMIRAFARAGVVLGEPDHVARAERAAEFVWTRLRDDQGRLLRRWREGEARFEASLDDHAFLAFGLLSLYEATGRARWLERVLELHEATERLFRDVEGGGYFFAAESPDLLVRLKDFHDGALPSGNAMQALLLARLGALLDREELRERAEETVGAFRSPLTRIPSGFPLMLSALTEAREAPRTLYVVGEGAGFDARLREAHRDLFPGRVIVPVPASERDALEALGVPLHGRTAPAGEARAWLCEAASCRPWDREPSA